MTKTLSEQLCECCGIDNDGCKNQTASCDCHGDAHCIKYIPQYPDFENNAENFVRLLELLHSLGFIIDNSTHRYREELSFKECFLSYLIILLKNEKEFFDKDYLDKYKQAIRQAEWEW